MKISQIIWVPAALLWTAAVCELAEMGNHAGYQGQQIEQNLNNGLKADEFKNTNPIDSVKAATEQNFRLGIKKFYKKIKTIF